MEGKAKLEKDRPLRVACFRCGTVIQPHEKMLTVHVSAETPTEDGALEFLEDHAISQLCSECASVILTEAVIKERLTMPSTLYENIEEIREDGYTEENTKATACHHYDRGCDYLHDGYYDLAIDELTKAIELDPNNAMSYDRRGIAYGEICEYDNAISDFNTAIEIDDTYAGAYNNRALAYYKKDVLGRAIIDYNKAIELSPDISVFYSNRGLAHYYSDEYIEAIADFNTAIELGPDDLETYTYRGEACAAIGEFDKAIADFDRAIALNPCDIIAYGNRVWASKLKEEGI
jgi:tetratricopeptide (TPR) repeat protein